MILRYGGGWAGIPNSEFRILTAWNAPSGFRALLDPPPIELEFGGAQLFDAGRRARHTLALGRPVLELQPQIRGFEFSRLHQHHHCHLYRSPTYQLPVAAPLFQDQLGLGFFGAVAAKTVGEHQRFDVLGVRHRFTGRHLGHGRPAGAQHESCTTYRKQPHAPKPHPHFTGVRRINPRRLAQSIRTSSRPANRTWRT